MQDTSTNSVWNLLKDLGKKAGVTEVIINSAQTVFVEHQGDLVKLNVQLKSEDIESFAEEVAQLNNKSFGPEHPLLDGTLPDGSRINIVAKEYVQDGPVITIRRHLKSIKSFESSAGLFGLDSRWVWFFKTLVQARVNIIISGGTGVGKTTFMNLLLQEIDPMQRVITIEDTRELNFNLPNLVRLETRSSNYTGGVALNTRALVKNTLRMRPDRIIVGEVRGEEVFDLLQAMNTGHEGSMASVHASSTAECIRRIENLYLLAGYDVPVRAIRQQIGSAINFVIQLKRNREGQRYVAQVTELAGFEADQILMQDIGTSKEGHLQFTRFVPKCMAKLVEAGLPQEFFLQA